MDPPTIWLNPKIEVTNSPLHGKGMFALSRIESGEIIVRWGDGYTDRAGAEIAKAQGKGIMQWDEDIFSVELSPEEDPSNGDRYAINHSCDPNAWMSDVFTVVARRKIDPGEEVTVDYVIMETDEEFVSEWTCSCGSPRCRGRITGRDWRIPELQKRYQGHFSPLLNARIERASRNL